MKQSCTGSSKNFPVAVNSNTHNESTYHNLSQPTYIASYSAISIQNRITIIILPVYVSEEIEFLKIVTRLQL